MSKSRAAGTYFENRVVAFLNENGFPEAKRTEFSSPLGDITGLPIVLECKNQKAMTLPTWLDQARKSGGKVGKLFAVCHNRARKPISKTYVTFELDQIVPLLLELSSLREMNK